MSVEEHILELIPAYALGMLESTEEIQVGAHLRTCASCQEELRAYQRVVGDLPLAMVDAEPPPHLREKVLLQARRTKSGVQAPAPQGWWQRLKERFTFRTPAWGFVSLVLVLVLAGSNLFLWQRINQLENEAQAVLATIDLVGTEFAPGATGIMVISRDGEHGSVVVDGLPLLDESRQYQLWLIRDGQRTSGGVFSVYDEGYGVLKIEAPEPLISFQIVGITIEPAGGSPGPTGDRVLGGDI